MENKSLLGSIALILSMAFPGSSGAKTGADASPGPTALAEHTDVTSPVRNQFLVRIERAVSDFYEHTDVT
jgi:hypothetical protein